MAIFPRKADSHSNEPKGTTGNMRTFSLHYMRHFVDWKSNIPSGKALLVLKFRSSLF